MADKDHLILTAIGPDQVGLVQKISEFISRHGCNIEDSKMAVFCGEFAVIVLISGDGTNLVKIGRDYRAIETETYFVSIIIPIEFYNLFVYGKNFFLRNHVNCIFVPRQNIDAIISQTL